MGLHKGQQVGLWSTLCPMTWNERLVGLFLLIFTVTFFVQNSHFTCQFQRLACYYEWNARTSYPRFFSPLGHKCCLLYVHVLLRCKFISTIHDNVSFSFFTWATMIKEFGAEIYFNLSGFYAKNKPNRVNYTCHLLQY